MSSRGLQWAFFKVDTLHSSLGDFLHGFLLKFKPLTEEEFAIPATREIYDQTIENRITAKARFFLHFPPTSSRIARLGGRYRGLFSQIGSKNYLKSIWENSSLIPRFFRLTRSGGFKRLSERFRTLLGSVFFFIPPSQQSERMEKCRPASPCS